MSRKINNIPVVRIKLGVQDRRTIIEELKMQDQMAWGRMNNIRACAEERVVKEMVWVGKMNNIRACAEEIVEKEIVYA